MMSSGLTGRLRGTANRTWDYATQASKRAMFRLGIVPPPFRISIDITDRCNLRCPTCSKWRRPSSSEELSLDEWRLALERLRGVPLLPEIAIAGGEPFTRPDCLAVVELAQAQGFRTLLISNGWLVGEELVKEIQEVGLRTLMISLNSLVPSVHDASRGTEGSHERIKNLLGLWQAETRTTRLSLLTIVMESNCGELTRLAQLVQEAGLAGIMYQVLLPTEVHYSFAAEATMATPAEDWYEGSPLWVEDLPTLRRQISELLELQAAGYPILNPASQLRRFVTYYEDPAQSATVPCLGTMSRLHVDPLGEMRLCYGYPPIGNVLRDDPRQAWRSEQARRIRASSRDCSRPCRMLNCNL